jgi:hypothetical protein
MAPIPGGADDPTRFGAILDVGNPSTGEWARCTIPAAGWRLNALGTIFRYQGGRRAAGGAWALVLRHEKRLNIRGASIGLSLDEPAPGALAVVLTMGSHRYCPLFDGGAVKRDAPRRFAAREQHQHDEELHHVHELQHHLHLDLVDDVEHRLHVRRGAVLRRDLPGGQPLRRRSDHAVPLRGPGGRLARSGPHASAMRISP